MLDNLEIVYRAVLSATLSSSYAAGFTGSSHLQIGLVVPFLGQRFVHEVHPRVTRFNLSLFARGSILHYLEMFIPLPVHLWVIVREFLGRVSSGGSEPKCGNSPSWGLETTNQYSEAACLGLTCHQLVRLYH